MVVILFGWPMVRLARKPLAEPVERRRAIEGEVVAKLGLGEEQPMTAAGVFFTSRCRTA
jgi:hypothetical protein